VRPLDAFLRIAAPRGRRAGSGAFQPGTYTEAAGQYVMCCPAHADRRPSLGVRELPDGKLLLRCYAGCDSADVLAALHLRWQDLRP
jgi:hypothetical protein